MTIGIDGNYLGQLKYTQIKSNASEEVNLNDVTDYSKHRSKVKTYINNVCTQYLFIFNRPKDFIFTECIKKYNKLIERKKDNPELVTDDNIKYELDSIILSHIANDIICYM